MSHAEFALLSRKVVADAIAAPAAFRARLWRWILGTYAAAALLAMLPLLGCALVVGSAVAKGGEISPGTGLVAALVLVFGLALWGSLSHLLRARIAIPGGLEISRGEAPHLYAALDELCHAAKTKPFDGVLLTHLCNAQVAQGPRPGRRGRRRYLVLGVPMLQGLPPEEVRAILAHEISHRADYELLGRMADRLEHALSLMSPGMRGVVTATPRGMLDAPLAWFVPRFRARYIALSRLREYAADRASAEVYGSQCTAFALGRFFVVASCFDAWMLDLGREPLSRQHPPEDLPTHWARGLEAFSTAQCAKWFEKARRTPAEPASTHPSLRERWEALGAAAPLETPLPASQGSAWEIWLGESRERVTRKFAAWWAASITQPWHGRRETLKEADAIRRQPEPLSGSALERANWACDQMCAHMELEGRESARPFAEKTLELNPAHEGVLRWMIHDRLENDDPAVKEWLRRFPTGPNKEALWLATAALFARLGATAEENAAYREADLAAAGAPSLERECGPLRPGEVIRPHELTAGQAALLVERAAVNPFIQKLAIVRKELPSRPEQVFHLIVAQASGQVQQRNSCAYDLNAVLSAGRVEGYWRILAVPRVSGEYSRAILRVPGAILYDRRHAAR